jgi:glycolate oxidase
MSPDYVVQDAVIPKSGLAEMLRLIYDEADRHGIVAVTIMHAGDGNLHPNFLFDARKPAELEAVELISKKLMQRVMQLGGTLSGEHGIGNDKSSYMAAHLGPVGQALQIAIPRVFNPRHQLNPLKVFPERRFI